MPPQMWHVLFLCTFLLYFHLYIHKQSITLHRYLKMYIYVVIGYYSNIFYSVLCFWDQSMFPKINPVFIAAWIVWMYNNLLFNDLTKDCSEMGFFMCIFDGGYVQEFLLGVCLKSWLLSHRLYSSIYPFPDFDKSSPKCFAILFSLQIIIRASVIFVLINSW